MSSSRLTSLMSPYRMSPTRLTSALFVAPTMPHHTQATRNNRYRTVDMPASVFTPSSEAAKALHVAVEICKLL